MMSEEDHGKLREGCGTARQLGLGEQVEGSRNIRREVKARAVEASDVLLWQRIWQYGYCC